jgi:WhiB family redox-sensing transcriptional regulator
MEYPDWQGTPNCRSVESEEFFVPEGSSTYREVKMLKKICGNCEVKKQCLDYSLKNAVFGFWGGTTEYERKLMRNKLNIIAKPLYLGYP